MSKKKNPQGELFGPPNPFIIRTGKAPNEDYCESETLTEWLRLKYNMSYKSYRREPKSEREMYRIEYMLDTGRDLPDMTSREANAVAYDDAMQTLMDCGVPFAYGEPIGIGWDD